jgi:hypothetical protein
MSIHVHKNEPYQIENGRLWYNPDDGETRVYSDGEWIIVPTADYLWGIEAERERIIKLLEEDCHSYDGKAQCPCGAITPEQVDYVVALIKGSQNVEDEIDNPSEKENK